VLYKDIFFYFAGKRFFFIYSWCDFFTGKRKTLCTILLRYIRYVSSDWRQFHPHMHACTYCVCGRACVRACGQACVCVCQADTHPQQQSICRRRSWCRQRSSSALSNPRTSQRRSWCTEPSLRYMYTRHHTQLSASFYVSIYQDDLTASTRYQNYWHVCMHVCRYVHIYYAPSKSTHYFCHGKEMGKNKKYFSHLAREAYQVCACVRAIYTLLITHNSVQVFTSLYIKMTLLQALLITFICMYVCMYVRIVSVEVTKLRTNKQHPLSVCMCTCMYACMYVCTYILCPNYEDPSRETRFRIHMYVCIYVCIYLSIERECV